MGSFDGVFPHKDEKIMRGMVKGDKKHEKEKKPKMMLSLDEKEKIA